jgi:hypothetical protein
MNEPTSLRVKFKTFCENFSKFCLGIAVGILFCTSQKILQHNNFSNCIQSMIENQIIQIPKEIK